MTSKIYFDIVASQWDAIRKSLYSESVRKKTISAASVTKGKVAADIGAGTGFITEGLVRRGVRVIAVDQSEMMLGEMKRKFVGFDIEYRVGDAARLPISDESVDYVFADMYLHHVESPAAAVKEMGRILRPGGSLVITDMDRHNFEFLREEHHDRWMGFGRDEVKKWLLDAELNSVRIGDIDENCCAETDTGECATVSVFLALGEK